MHRTPVGRRAFATWTYGLHVSIEYNATSPPNAEQALAGLTPAHIGQVADEETSAFRRGSTRASSRSARGDPRRDVMCRETGGTRYLSGWLGEMDEGRWRAHFGDKYIEWVDAKRRLDADGIFVSRLLPAS